MIHNILFKYKWYIQATGEVLLMLSLYSLGSGWPCVRNPLCLCWWECPWVDGWMEGPVRFSLPCWGGFLSCPVLEPRRDAAPGQNSSLLVGVRFLSCPASKLLSVPLLVGIALESWVALCQNSRCYGCILDSYVHRVLQWESPLSFMTDSFFSGTN